MTFHSESSEKRPSVAILGDGDFPAAALPQERLDRADIIVCCDASVLKLTASGRKPDYIVGDMDTLSPQEQERFREIIRRDADQECNDQTKAFRFALALHPGRISILGATGGREDHTLGNISLLADYARTPYCRETGCPVEIVTDHGIFTPHLDSCRIESEPGQQISLFAFDSSLKIKSAGLAFPTDQVIFDFWWKATLNEAVSDSFSLEFSHPAPVLVFRSSLKR